MMVLVRSSGEFQQYGPPRGADSRSAAACRPISFAAGARTASAVGASCRKLFRDEEPRPLEVRDGGVNNVRSEAGGAGNVSTRADAVANCLRDEGEWPTHTSRLPIWKIPTASSQDPISWTLTPNNVHFSPISRICVASTAMHGV